MKRQIKTLRLNKTKISELSVTDSLIMKGGKSGNVPNCPTRPLCFTQNTCITETPECMNSVLACDNTF